MKVFIVVEEQEGGFAMPGILSAHVDRDAARRDLQERTKEVYNRIGIMVRDTETQRERIAWPRRKQTENLELKLPEVTEPEQPPERMCGMKVTKDEIEYDAWSVEELIEKFVEWDGLPEQVQATYLDAKIFIMSQHIDVETEDGWLRAVVGDYILSGPDGLEPVGQKELTQFYQFGIKENIR